MKAFNKSIRNVMSNLYVWTLKAKSNGQRISIMKYQTSNGNYKDNFSISYRCPKRIHSSH